MTNAPRLWTESELATQAKVALDEFVNRRLAEPSGAYRMHVESRRAALKRLLRQLSEIDFNNPSPTLVRQLLFDEDMYSALRYLAGPPISEDDLGVIVTRSIDKVGKTALSSDDKLPVSIFNLICDLSDPYRFPWILQRRKPTAREVRDAISMTSVLHATQTLQTERRGYGKLLEQKLQDCLLKLGFAKISGGAPSFPRGGKIKQPSHYPAVRHFYGECTLYGRKIDLFIALKTGLMIALEAKDSSSAINSIKRLLNDTTAKAAHYEKKGGEAAIISIALLSGVYKVSDLVKAQNTGLRLVWAHELDKFVDWINSQS